MKQTDLIQAVFEEDIVATQYLVEEGYDINSTDRFGSTALHWATQVANMITIKAFDKNLICRGFKYKVGKTYTMPKEDVRLCESGFHTSLNCDISETIPYYSVSEDTEYAIVDIDIVDKNRDKVVGDKIKGIKK